VAWYEQVAASSNDIKKEKESVPPLLVVTGFVINKKFFDLRAILWRFNRLINEKQN
jgi:hypothetical protein